MRKYIPGNQKHLTLEDHIYIENEQNKDTSFKDIARFLFKDPTTISKEVRAHHLSDGDHKGTFYYARNFCVHRYHFRKTNVCSKIVLCGIKSTSCPTCNQTCRNFEKEHCLRHDRTPYVCNSSEKNSHCTTAHKYNYNARFTDRKYRKKLRNSRSVINMTKQELYQKDQIISPLIEQRQSPYHILTNHPELDMSVRTMYFFLDQGLFTARNIDPKRKVRFKPRKCHKAQITDRTFSTNRLYSDFCSLNLSGYVEMDTAHSTERQREPSCPCFQRNKKLFLAFLMNRCAKGAVRLFLTILKSVQGLTDSFLYLNTS